MVLYHNRSCYLWPKHILFLSTSLSLHLIFPIWLILDHHQGKFSIVIQLVQLCCEGTAGCWSRKILPYELWTQNAELFFSIFGYPGFYILRSSLHALLKWCGQFGSILKILCQSSSYHGQGLDHWKSIVGQLGDKDLYVLQPTWLFLLF